MSRLQCLRFLPIPRVTASLTLEKMLYSQHELRVWVLVPVIAQRRVRSWRVTRVIPLSPVHISRSQVPVFASRVFLYSFLYMLLFVEQSALLPHPPDTPNTYADCTLQDKTNFHLLI